MPKITFTAVAVVTLDGKIAKNSKHNVDWSSKEDKRFLRQKIKESDVIIVGRNTFEVARKALTKKKLKERRYIVFTSSVAKSKEQSKQVLFVNPARVDLKNMIKGLGYKKVCILGGTKTYSLMVKKGLTDEIFLTVEPIIFGSGLAFLDGDLPLKRFKLVSIKKLNSSGTLLIHYKK